MTILFIFTTAFITGLSGAIVPGPLLSFTMAETLKRGFRAAPLTILGHGILELALILAILGGLSVYLQKPAVFNAIALIGGLFLLWMGISLIRDGMKGGLSPLPTKIGEQEANVAPSRNDKRLGLRASSIAATPEGYTPKRGLHPVAGGILISLANPYWILWWITIGLGYLSLALKSGNAGVISFFSGHILADLGWYSLVAAALCGGRKFLHDAVFHVLIIGCGIFLLVLGAYFIYMGFRG